MYNLKLQIISLCHNQISHIDSNTFNNLNYLSELGLNGNKCLLSFASVSGGCYLTKLNVEIYKIYADLYLRIEKNNKDIDHFIATYHDLINEIESKSKILSQNLHGINNQLKNVQAMLIESEKMNLMLNNEKRKIESENSDLRSNILILSRNISDFRIQMENTQIERKKLNASIQRTNGENKSLQLLIINLKNDQFNHSKHTQELNSEILNLTSHNEILSSVLNIKKEKDENWAIIIIIVIVGCTAIIIGLLILIILLILKLKVTQIDKKEVNYETIKVNERTQADMETTVYMEVADLMDNTEYAEVIEEPQYATVNKVQKKLRIE